ncbi:protein kinase [Durotheca rogersii]|uniref:protein kinase n=1 Tax=Durotheca rogersii TaxID=419775 RepID=UPI0022210E26|nr:protein kinase [Durotheca rogersii]KAI5860058.1 protein kinase [Durotheca rogersii]
MTVDSPAPPPPHDPPLPAILTYPSSFASSSSDAAAPDPGPPPPTLVAQGAEACLYRTTFVSPSLPCALKYRPPKAWRHPALDARLTRHRILAEARVLARCRREGVPVPALYAVDEAAGWLAAEWIDGPPARVAINRWLARRAPKSRRKGGRIPAEEGDAADKEDEGDNDDRAEPEDAAPITGADPEDKPLVELLQRIASAVGRLHKAGVVHGDLTTSNMMLRPRTSKATPTPNPSPSTSTTPQAAKDGIDKQNIAAAAADDDAATLLEGDVVLIDFGLASQGTGSGSGAGAGAGSDEDRAVDLYVLERAFASTHSRAEALFAAVLESAYAASYPGARAVLRKLDEVRMRGRKRSMVG